MRLSKFEISKLSGCGIRPLFIVRVRPVMSLLDFSSPLRHSGRPAWVSVTQCRVFERGFGYGFRC